MTDEPTSYEDVRDLAERTRRTVKSLLAFSVTGDPYYAGSPARRARAGWFANLWQELKLKPGIHLRSIHYKLVMQLTPVVMPTGEPYQNTVNCQAILMQAVRDARYLGLVPANAIIDRKNPAPTINLEGDEDTTADIEFEPGEIEQYEFGTNYSAPTIKMPELVLNEPTVHQRYHLEIWIEKSTMNDVVMPVGKANGVNIATFEGDCSTTACEDLIRRAKASGKPVRILYVSDFDPRGNKMPVGAARKIDFLGKTSGHKLDIRLIPVTLTLQQCIDLKLPRVAIKDSDGCAPGFEARFGEGATELDALSEDQLREILVTEIERYIDADIDDRIDEVASAVRADLRHILRRASEHFSTQIATLNERRDAINATFRAVRDPAQATYEAAILAAREEYDDAIEEVRDQIEEMEQQFVMDAEPTIDAINSTIEAWAPDADDFEWPEPAEAEEIDDPLYDSKRPYLTQLDRFRRHNKGDDDNEDPTLKRRRNGSNHALTADDEAI